MKGPGLVPTILLSLWPVLALGARNPRGFDGLDDLLPPLVLAVAVAVVSWWLSRMFSSDANTRSVLGVTMVGFWWGYASLVSPLRATGVLPASFVGPVIGGVLVLFIWALAQRWPRMPERVSGALTILGAILLVSTGGQLMFGRMHTPIQDVSGLEVPEPILPRNGRTPDVHIIVLDTYTGARSLLQNYGFDNTPFLRGLEARGFVLPREFHANYPGTATAVAALLNWDYVQNFAPDLDPTTTDRGQLEPLVEESRTWRFFARSGYAITYVFGGFTGENRYATDRLTFSSGAFRDAWLAMTPLRSLNNWPFIWGARSDPTDRSTEAARHDQRFRFALERATGAMPRLTFAHLLLPHDPYVYRADCSHRTPPLVPWYDRDIPEAEDRAAYLEQLTCTNLKTLALVDGLMRLRPEPPMILLMSDHGRSTMRFGLLSLEEATDAQVSERLDNFGAFLVPDSVRARFANVRTPVGAMRALMREVFGLPVLDLPERAYWASHRRPFSFQEVVLDQVGEVVRPTRQRNSERFAP